MRRARPLLGTLVEISVAEAAGLHAEAAVEAAFDVVAKVHGLMSFHQCDSDVSRLNREASVRAVSVHSWTFQVLEAALDLQRRSAGMFDIAVAPVRQNAAPVPGGGGERAAVPMTGEAIELLHGRRVRFRHQAVQIDLGGIAKGFAVDRAVDVLRSRGVARGLVNAGGDLAAFGPPAHTIHVRDPRDPRRLMFAVEVGDGALATSGGTFDPFRSADVMAAAVVDPRSGEPVRAIRGATVRAPTCMHADALTKIVMIGGESSSPLLRHYRANALFVAPDGELRVSPGWQDAVHLAA